MAPILDTLAESEPLFTGDRLADYPLYKCLICTQATSQSRFKSHAAVHSLSEKEKTGDGPGGGGGRRTNLSLPRGGIGLGVPSYCDLLSTWATQLT